MQEGNPLQTYYQSNLSSVNGTRLGVKALCAGAAFLMLAASLILPPADAMVGGHSFRASGRSSGKGHVKKAIRGQKTFQSIGRNSRGITLLRRGGSSRGGRAEAKRGSKKQGRAARKTVVVHKAPRPLAPQQYLGNLNRLTLRPGVEHLQYKGPLTINVVDVNMNSDVKVRPYLASDQFNSLKATRDQAREAGALVAVNANYFKKDGTPLGAIKIDGEWVSGDLFNRVAMGLTKDGTVKFARVNLHGILSTSNPDVPTAWINNMNTPRRTGVKAVLYTRRWGDYVNLPYDGVVVGIDNRGEVVDTHSRSMRIPYGGYVLTDRKESDFRNLKRGDLVSVDWRTNPSDWQDVVHVISGGPTLIKNGNLYVGLKDERFRTSWTSSKITQRTACGYTSDRHLILATVEGTHNMWDLAKFMQSLGCVDAMNLDGGGSTTMVVAGQTVTRNTGGQRKVAATLTVMEPQVAARFRNFPGSGYMPSVDLTDFVALDQALKEKTTNNGTGKISDIDLLSASQHLSPDAAASTGFKCEFQDKIPIDDDLVDRMKKLRSTADATDVQAKEQSRKWFKKPIKKAVKQRSKEKDPGWSRMLNPFNLGKHRS